MRFTKRTNSGTADKLSILSLMSISIFSPIKWKPWQTFTWLHYDFWTKSYTKVQWEWVSSISYLINVSIRYVICFPFFEFRFKTVPKIITILLILYLSHMTLFYTIVEIVWLRSSHSDRRTVRSSDSSTYLPNLIIIYDVHVFHT